MQGKISRRKLSSHIADRIVAGDMGVVDELAAYLVANRRTKESALMIRDIEAALALRGETVADIATAHELTAESRTALEEFVVKASNAKKVHIRATVDANLIGGARVAIPGKLYDGTVAHKLEKLVA